MSGHQSSNVKTLKRLKINICDPVLNRSNLLRCIHDSIIGDYSIFSTVYGKRSLIYADYIASGRALKFIEDYMQQEILPSYANTHTVTSTVGLQTTSFREESRQIIHKCLNASDDDVVLFLGSGATSAINKLVGILQMKEQEIWALGSFERRVSGVPARTAIRRDSTQGDREVAPGLPRCQYAD